MTRVIRVLTLVRADARKREWFACNGVGMRAASRARLNKSLGRMKSVVPLSVRALIIIALSGFIASHALAENEADTGVPLELWDALTKVLPQRWTAELRRL